MRSLRNARAHWRRAAALLAVCACGGARLAAQQDDERPEIIKALELENAGKYREAAALFRTALQFRPSANGILGLERVYAELGASDSLLAPLLTLIAAEPREAIYRTVQLRTLQILRRGDALRDAFEQWVHAVPRDAAPYREYARILIQLGRLAAADSVVSRGRVALGSVHDLEYENAQLRAAMGEWVPSAQAWRRVLADSPHLAIAAAYALAPAPAAQRELVLATLASPPAQPGPRRALAELDLSWGRPQDAWDALRVLAPDTSAATMWEEFGDRAYSEERWSLARDALVSAVRVRRSSQLALRAATASLRAGNPTAAVALIPLDEFGNDSARAAREYLPLHVTALAILGRARDADALIASYDRFTTPVQRMRLAQLVATAWVRAGDMGRARDALRAAGPDADSSEAAGWLALYEGHLSTARLLLRTARDPSPELALALGILARTKGDSAPRLGAAFLSLSRGDSVAAAAKFADASTWHPEVSSALLLVAARLQDAHGTDATPLWARIVADHPATPEAVESELEWARALRKKGDTAGAVTHLEHLILSAPQSALLPQARRELELARGTVPAG